MIDIKRHDTTLETPTYDICIYTNLNTLPSKFIQRVKVSKEEVIEIIEKLNLYPTPLSVTIYRNILGLGEFENGFFCSIVEYCRCLLLLQVN